MTQHQTAKAVGRQLRLSTKAQTLEQLSDCLTRARVLPLYYFTVSEFEQNPNRILEDIRNAFPEAELLVVRSSALSEDNTTTSNAGHYRSMLNVPIHAPDMLEMAIRAVIASYDQKSPMDEVLVQPMLESVRICGVVFTADLDTLAPYHIVNYDESGSTDAITSGSSGNTKTYIHFKNAPIPAKNQALGPLLETCDELEALFGNPFLDIEFAIDENNVLFILQVRPITTAGKTDLSQLDLVDHLEKLHRKLTKLSRAHPSLLGDKSIFGIMPDWNPAEIIGIHPRPLALSLYKELITDSIWAYQRDNYGYRNLRSSPLLMSFLGLPYVDVRVDFNSFIPKSLDEGIAGKLCDYYLDQLIENPNFHDKVEFEIVHSCYYLNITERLAALKDHGFNGNEIKRIEFSLLNLTNTIICPEKGHYKQDLARLQELETRYQAIVESDLSTIDKIYWLVEDCKRYGTLPFAGVARAAFIAVQFLQSFVTTGIITHEEYHAFMASLNTVSRKITDDLDALFSDQLSREEFLQRYGHLRPGTYDILSPRYDENFEGYFSQSPAVGNDVQHTPFSFTDSHLDALDKALVENGLQISANELISFIQGAIEARESAKLSFTRSLSKVLQLIETLGQRVGLQADDLSYLNIKTVLNLYSVIEQRDVRDILLSDITVNRTGYRYTQAIRLPGLILSPDDIYEFFVDAESPNYITLKSVEAPVAVENANAVSGNIAERFQAESLAGRIVLIQSADPGYDFLFSKGIAGLITQYGGANSHMAIRCAELGIPAVIGAGEKLFGLWSKARVLQLDCAGKQVRVLS